MPLTREESLVLQSGLTSVLLRDLDRHNDEFVDSNFFQEMSSDFPGVKEYYIKGATGVGNQGTMMMQLYALLVIPKELISAQFQTEYNDIDAYISKIAINITDTYPLKNQFTRHLRNAVSHARAEFDDTDKNDIKVTFTDEDNRTGFRFSATFGLYEMSQILLKLLKIHQLYTEDIRRRNPNML